MMHYIDCLIAILFIAWLWKWVLLFVLAIPIRVLKARKYKKWQYEIVQYPPC